MDATLEGRKSKFYYMKDGVMSEEIPDIDGENTITVSGIGSEFILCS